MTPITRRRSGLSRLYRGETNIDFVGTRRWALIISLVLVGISLISLFTRGLSFGIEFEGGVSWEVSATELTVPEARSELGPFGLGDARMQVLRGSEGERIRIQAGPQDTATTDAVGAALAAAAGVSATDVSFTSIGPSWGEEISSKAVRALIVFLIAVALYITLRFEWRMALAAMVSVAHDIIVTIGVYSVFGFDVTPATVIAFLTILGYSLYDTIVVFDRVDENTRHLLISGRGNYTEVVNRSVNQVLMRSVNTTVSSIVPVLSLLVVGAWIMGAIALADFAVALLVGMIVGAYSSIFVAVPLLAVLKEREPRFAAMRERTEHARSSHEARVAAEAAKAAKAAPATSDPRDVPEGPTETAKSVLSAGMGHPPRPRKPRKR